MHADFKAAPGGCGVNVVYTMILKLLKFLMELKVSVIINEDSFKKFLSIINLIFFYS